MFKWFLRRQIAAFERQNDYDMSYARALLDTDPRALFAIFNVSGLSRYRRDVPADVYYAAKITGTLAEDCGPCTQLVVGMALRDGVPAATLAALVSGADAELAAPVRLGVDFARAVLARESAEDLRAEVVRRYGERGLISLAFAITSARLYPTLKYALGKGASCQRVVVAGKPVSVVRKAA